MSNPADIKELNPILSRIRHLGSLLQSAGLAIENHEDWDAVIGAGEMIVNEAEKAFALLEELEK